MNILILTTYPNNTSTKYLVREIKKRGHSVTIWNYWENMYIITSNSGGHHRIYHKGDRVYKGKFDVIIPRIGKKLAYGSEVLDMLVKYQNVPSIIQPEALRLAANKWHTDLVLAQNGILSPITTKIHKYPKDLKQLAKILGGFPIIAKGEFGSQGKNVFLLKTEREAKLLLEHIVTPDNPILLQQFVNTSSSERKQDIRAWVIGEKYIGAFIRYSNGSEDVRTNYSINKDGESVELTEQEKQIAIKVAKVTGLAVVAVDLARCSDTGKVYVYEINGNGSLNGFTKVTGINLAGHIIDYAEQIATGNGKKGTQINLEDFTKEPSNKLATTIDLGNHKAAYDQLSSNLSEKYGKDLLPLLLLQYYLESQKCFFAMEGLEKQKKAVEKSLSNS